MGVLHCRCFLKDQHWHLVFTIVSGNTYHGDYKWSWIYLNVDGGKTVLALQYVELLGLVQDFGGEHGVF
jgi:hypothetical protein